MSTQYTLTHARRRLAAIVRELDTDDHIVLTRRGQPVAVLVSPHAHQRLSVPKVGFREAYQAWRQAVGAAGIGIEVDETIADMRDRSPGRAVDL